MVDLKEGGSEIEVTNDNIGEYVELVLKHRLLLRMRDQLTAFLVGFYDVIPEALLSVFDFQELELLMCGLPHIDLEDWQKHTDYIGEFERKGSNHKVGRTSRAEAVLLPHRAAEVAMTVCLLDAAGAGSDTHPAACHIPRRLVLP